MKVLILSTSLNPRSKSHALAIRASEVAAAAGADTSLVELGTLDLPMCGAADSFDHPEAVALMERIKEADGVLIATPVYNYDVNAACKNAVELTGKGWKDKVVGFMCVAGGQSSYMSIMGLANSLMFDFRCVIVPRFVYATGTAFRDNKLVDDDVEKRVDGLCAELMRLASALAVDS